MIKYKTTDREQRENNCFVLGFSYGSIQNIERFLNPSAYTCGVYGWRADFYNFEGWSISTGYSPLRYMSKTGYKDIDAYRTKKAQVLRAGLERIEKRLNKGGYKWQKNGSFSYCREQLQKILKRLEKRANKEAQKESLKYRQ
jgi:hypothetical protein